MAPVGLFLFTAVAVWQIRTIVGSPYPAVRAFEALGVIVPLYLVLFASTYFIMERASATNFGQPLTRTDALYFTVTIFTTVGFGDIARNPNPPASRSRSKCSSTSSSSAPVHGYSSGP